jgi:hypothetical protein
MSSINICCNSVESSFIFSPKTAVILASSSSLSLSAVYSFKDFPPVLMHTNTLKLIKYLMNKKYELEIHILA